MSKFNICAIAAAATATLTLRDAAGEELFVMDGDERLPVSITTYGPGTTDFARAQQRFQDRIAKRVQKGKGKATLPSPEEQREDRAELLAALTVSFNNLDYPDAGDAQGYELFRALYADPRLGFIADQVNNFVGDWGNFTPKSATS